MKNTGIGEPEPLRILFMTSDRFPPFRPAAKAIFADEFKRRGHVVDWLIAAESEAVGHGARRFGLGTAYVARTNDGPTRRSRLRKYWLDFRNDLKAFSLLATHRYSLLQVKDKYAGALVAIVAAKYHRVPFFYWLAYPHPEASLYAARTGAARYRWLYLLRGRIQHALLYRVILPAARHVFVQSEQMRVDIANKGIPLERMTPVPSSLNVTEMQRAADKAARKLPDEQWIVYLGTLLRERRLDFLVRVLARVRGRVPRARLLLVGQGARDEEERLITEEAKRLGIADSITITGWLPSREALSYVRSADVCVSPYYPIPILKSTSPTKLVEYMALGKAVVGNDHPEQSSVLRDSGAGLVCAWDEDEFAEALIELLENPDKTRDMGLAGQRYVMEHRTHTKMADLVAACYRRELVVATRPDKSKNVVHKHERSSDASAPRRLCILLPTHWSDLMGGSQYQAKLLVEHLIGQGTYEISYLTTRVAPGIEAPGYRIIQFSKPGGLTRYGFFFDAFRLYRALARVKPDVIYQQVGCGHTGIAAFYAKRNGCRMIWRVSSDASVLPARAKWWQVHRAIERLFLSYGIRNADVILAQTRTQQELLAERYGRADSILIRNFHPVPPVPTQKPSMVRIVWIGNFKRVKNPEAFVRVACRLGHRSDVEFLVIGDSGRAGPWAKRLLDDIASAPNLRYLGCLSQADVNRVLEESHILVNTSSVEGFPNTFIQAWMRGVAIVSLNVDPDDLLSRERLGLLSRTEDQLVSDVSRLIECRGLREELTRKGRAFATEHHSEANIAVIAQLLA